MNTVSAKIYFSDFFEVSSEALEGHGALNISLINDLPLFIDPFLLFDSVDPKHKQLHEEIIRYVKFLRDVSSDTNISKGLLDSWFGFPEVSQNWLGFSKTGNRGSGLGKQFAGALHRNLHQVFKDFGSESITLGSHLEKLCLLADGVGRDHLSDFTTNLIKQYLLDYTQTFAQAHIAPHFRRQFAIDRVTFDYGARRWKRGMYELPIFNNDYVLLTPKAILTKDEAWINRSDLLDNFQSIYQSMPDEHLRAQVNEYFLRRLSEDAKEEQVREAAATTIEQFPQMLDYYILHKEESGDEAHKVSNSKVRDTEQQFIHQIRALVDQRLTGTEFYQESDDSYVESLRRLHFLKSVIEDQDGYRFFYHDGKPIHCESDLQLMYKLTWCASTYDVNREVNNGRGPVDFKVSKGSRDKTLVEFKLASNSKLKQNLKHQIGVYEEANDTAKSIKAILYFSESEFNKVQNILKEFGLVGRSDVVLIDACPNKPSASNVRDDKQATLAFNEEE